MTNLERYDRQMRIPGFGTAGQEKLKQARVVIAGVGGLGSPQSLYLTAAGVGQLTLIDFDVVAPSNLNRQILHWEEDLGRPKVESAREKLRRLNSTVNIHVVKEAITTESVLNLFEGHHVVLDAMDNLATRKIINQACVRLKIPLIYGGIHGLTGMVSTIVPGVSACLECLFPGDLPAAVFPVLGTTPGVVANLQVTEAIKFLTGLGRLLINRLLIYEGLDMTFKEITINRHPDCPVCRSSRPLPGSHV